MKEETKVNVVKERKVLIEEIKDRFIDAGGIMHVTKKENKFLAIWKLKSNNISVLTIPRQNEKALFGCNLESIIKEQIIPQMIEKNTAFSELQISFCS